MIMEPTRNIKACRSAPVSFGEIAARVRRAGKRTQGDDKAIEHHRSSVVDTTERRLYLWRVSRCPWRCALEVC